MLKELFSNYQDPIEHHHLLRDYDARPFIELFQEAESLELKGELFGGKGTKISCHGEGDATPGVVEPVVETTAAEPEHAAHVRKAVLSEDFR